MSYYSSSAPTRSAVLFTDAIPKRDERKGTAYKAKRHYILSLRDQKDLRVGCELRYQHISSIDDIFGVPWSSRMMLNYDDRLNWISSHARLVSRLFYLDFLPYHEFWFASAESTAVLGRNANRLKYQTRQLTGHPDRQLSTPITACLVQSAQELEALLKPDSVGDFVNWVGIGQFAHEIEGQLPESMKVIERSSKKPVISDIFEDSCCGGPSTTFALKMDFLDYDVPDPHYCIDAALTSDFEAFVKSAVTESNYTFHLLPLIPSVVRNWFGYGYIPVVQN
jgi:hypothetical protein